MGAGRDEAADDGLEEEIGRTRTADAGDLHATADQIRRFRLTVVEGSTPGQTWESSSDRWSIGSHALNDTVLDDATVSRFHCEISIRPDGVVAKDLGSRNGTTIDGVRVMDAFLREGSILRLGRVALRTELVGTTARPLVSSASSFGPLVSASIAMRQCFALLERAASSDVNVLLEGETGTGKSVAARAVHDASARRKGPFVVVDCGALPHQLLDSELFGHERGAFTGAEARRVGAFEEASGGTVFLDEVAELPPDLQPKLLRVIEERVVRRVGSNAPLDVDVRIVAASNRDLRAEVNAGRFRSDLFFRLAVLRIVIPPLREHPEDIPVVVDGLLQASGADAETSKSLRAPEFLAALRRSAWPGNVRELRNHLERCIVLEQALGPSEERPAAGFEVDPSVPYAEARQRILETFERAYVQALLASYGGHVTRMASAAGMARTYLHRLLRRHGIKA